MAENFKNQDTNRIWEQLKAIADSLGTGSSTNPPNFISQDAKKIWEQINRISFAFGVSSSPLLIATTNLTSAQILGIFATPVLHIPAPGTNKLIFPLQQAVKLIFNTVPYTSISGVPPLITRYSGTIIDTVSNNNILGSTLTRISASDVTPLPFGELLENVAMELSSNVVPLNGNSVVIVNTIYTILTF